MNNGRWSPTEEQFIRDNAGKLTLEQMADHVGRSELAVQLFIHRRRIQIGTVVKRNLVLEIIKLRYQHPEDFTPSTAFYKSIGLNQRRWWDIYFGRKPIIESEYLTISKYFGITLEEAFECRQLSLFDTEI